MTPLELDSSLLARLDPVRMGQYARSRGWRRNPAVREPLAAYEHPSVADTDLIVPLEPEYRDYAALVEDAVQLLAEVEHRRAIDVVLDLLSPPADVLSFGLVGPGLERGAAPLLTAIGLLDGCRRVLTAAALDVARVRRRVHPRLRSNDADQLVAGSQVVTATGSFVVQLICPIDAVRSREQDGRQQQLNGLEHLAPTFTRRVTSHLMRAAKRLVDCAREDRLHELDGAPTDQPQISANLIEELLSLQPVEPHTRLVLSSQWEPQVPADDLPSTVEIRQEYREPLERVASRWRQSTEPEACWLFGKIAQAERDASAEPDAPGEVELYTAGLFDEGEMRVGFWLEGDDFSRACDALKNGSYVAVEGILHRQLRQPHTLSEPRSFEVLTLRGLQARGGGE